MTKLIGGQIVANVIVSLKIPCLLKSVRKQVMHDYFQCEISLNCSLSTEYAPMKRGQSVHMCDIVFL